MHGGKRERAGRPPGSLNKATIDRQREVEESGITPLNFLLSVMRDEDADIEKRLDAAKAAAPYVHPKLSSIQHGGNIGYLSHEEALDQLDHARRQRR